MATDQHAGRLHGGQDDDRLTSDARLPGAASTPAAGVKAPIAFSTVSALGEE